MVGVHFVGGLVGSLLIGFFADPKLSDTIWIHAVSVGEMNAAAPLIEALMKRFEGRRFVVTTVTPTGSARIALESTTSRCWR